MIFSGVSADTQAAAWDYMKYLTSKQASVSFAKQTGYVPIRQSAFNSPEMQDYYKQAPATRVPAQQLNNTFVASILPGWQNCRNEITSGYTSVLKGQASSDDALNTMAQKCPAALAS